MDEEGPTGVVYGAVSAARTGMHLPWNKKKNSRHGLIYVSVVPARTTRSEIERRLNRGIHRWKRCKEIERNVAWSIRRDFERTNESFWRNVRCLKITNPEHQDPPYTPPSFWPPRIRWFNARIVRYRERERERKRRLMTIAYRVSGRRRIDRRIVGRVTRDRYISSIRKISTSGEEARAKWKLFRWFILRSFRS